MIGTGDSCSAAPSICNKGYKVFHGNPIFIAMQALEKHSALSAITYHTGHMMADAFQDSPLKSKR